LLLPVWLGDGQEDENDWKLSSEAKSAQAATEE
jgi:hypothetical protein